MSGIFSQSDVERFGEHVKGDDSAIRQRKKVRSKKRIRMARLITSLLITLAVVVTLLGIAWVTIPPFLEEKYVEITYEPEERAERAAKLLADQEIPAFMGVETLEAAKQKGYTVTATAKGIEGGYWIIDIAYTVDNLDLRTGKKYSMKHSTIVRVDAVTYEAEIPTTWT